MLDTLFSDECSKAEKEKVLQEDYGIEMSPTLDKEVSSMCNLADNLEEKGIRIGRQEGRQEGIQEGKVEMRLEVVKMLLKRGDSIESVASLFDLPVSEVEALAEQLGG